MRHTQCWSSSTYTQSKACVDDGTGSAEAASNKIESAEAAIWGQHGSRTAALQGTTSQGAGNGSNLQPWVLEGVAIGSWLLADALPTGQNLLVWCKLPLGQGSA